MADPTYYLFDGYNLLHVGAMESQRELVDSLASFVALHGARGVVVFDGVGEDAVHGPLEVRFARQADHLIERLAVEHRESELVCVVSSDQAVRGTAGQKVRHRSSQGFIQDLASKSGQSASGRAVPSRVGDTLDAETRARLERLRRGGR